VRAAVALNLEVRGKPKARSKGGKRAG